jgi:two-component system nitrogen regulation response regulator GlnG
LVNHFLRLSQDAEEHPKSVSPAAMAHLENHDWPGNVRELENLVQRLAVLHTDETISEEVVAAELSQSAFPSMTYNTQTSDIEASIEAFAAELLRENNIETPVTDLYQRVLDKVEGPLLTLALNTCGGNQIKASDLLGLNRNTLRKKIRRHNIDIVKQSRQN